MIKEQAKNIVDTLIQRKPDMCYPDAISYKKDDFIIMILQNAIKIANSDTYAWINLDLSEREETELKWKIEDWYNKTAIELEEKAIEFVSNLDQTEDDLLVDPIDTDEL